MTCNCCGGIEWRPVFEENGFDLGRCPTCDLFYIRNMPSAETRMTEMEAGHFAGTQKVLDAGRQRASETALQDRFLGYIRGAQEYAPAGRWLDIGCGAGSLLLMAQEANYAVDGIELTADRLQAARSAGLTVHDVPVEECGFEDDTFDVVSMINVFSHLTDPAGTLSEVRRILRPGGVAIVVTGEVEQTAERSHVSAWNLGDHLYFLGERTMSEYCARIGFSIDDHDRVWYPDEALSRESLMTRGRSNLRNFVKFLIVKTPGFLPVLRRLVLWHQRGNSVYSSTFRLVNADKRV